MNMINIYIYQRVVFFITKISARKSFSKGFIFLHCTYLLTTIVCLR